MQTTNPTDILTKYAAVVPVVSNADQLAQLQKNRMKMDCIDL